MFTNKVQLPLSKCTRVFKKILGKLKYTDTESWALKWHDFLAVDGNIVTYKTAIPESISMILVESMMGWKNRPKIVKASLEEGYRNLGNRHPRIKHDMWLILTHVDASLWTKILLNC